MNEEENKNQDSKMNELIGRILLQSEQIIDKTRENGDEMCALIVFGAGGKSMSAIYSKGADKIVEAIANEIYIDPKLMDIVKAAIKLVEKTKKDRAMHHRKNSRRR